MFPGQFSAFKVVCTGRVCVRMYDRTWRPVLYVWHVNLRVCGGAPTGHVAVGHRWDRLAMDLLDLSVTSAREIDMC